MKICPVCKARCFEDMDICYGCMYRFNGEKSHSFFHQESKPDMREAVMRHGSMMDETKSKSLSDVSKDAKTDPPHHKSTVGLASERAVLPAIPDVLQVESRTSEQSDASKNKMENKMKQARHAPTYLRNEVVGRIEPGTEYKLVVSLQPILTGNKEGITSTQ